MKKHVVDGGGKEFGEDTLRPRLFNIYLRNREVCMMFGSEGSFVAEDILGAGRFVEKDVLMRKMF